MSVPSHLHYPVMELNGMTLYFVGEIAIIVMDNGENRINNTFLATYDKLLDEIERNQSCKGLITTAKGKFYGNGLDLDWLATVSPDQLAHFFLGFSALLIRLLLLPIPTLAAINGHAFAGGALFAITHDLRVQRQDRGWFCFNEVFINRQFVKFHHALMRTKIGSGQTYTDAVSLGRRYTGAEALSSGLVHAATPESLLLSESVQLLKSFYGKSGYPRESLHLMKADVYRDVVELYDVDQADIRPTAAENVENAVKPTSKL